MMNLLTPKELKAAKNSVEMRKQRIVKTKKQKTKNKNYI
jgi:hypothetical protein